MASHGNTIEPLDENLRLGPAAGGIKFGALGLGAICLVVAVVLSFLTGDADQKTAAHARFYHSYLTGFTYCLTIALAGLFFTMMQHLVKVGWSVNVRRVPEALAGTLPYLGILAIPLLIPVIGNKGGELYPWASPHGDGPAHHAAAQPAAIDAQFAAADAHAATAAAAEHHAAGGHDATHADSTHEEHASGHTPGEHSKYDYHTYDSIAAMKAPWLTNWFFTLRVIFYFAAWTGLAYYFYNASKRQDVTGDIAISQRLALVAPVGIITFALTLTFAMFDFVMSLDHHWYSTMFGVYMFAGGMIAMFATCIVTFMALQSRGFVRESVTTEHYHDLGKYLFAFIFFWGYVGFSQFMLQWYASIPEATPWWARRGVTSADLGHNTIGLESGFAGLSLVLLFGHFLIPFAYLISRHIKRSREALLVGAAWMLVAHMVDMYWLIMPEYDNGKWIFDFTVILTIVGVLGLFLFSFVQVLGGANLRPIRDPRAPESLAFTNM
ncbi:MAG: hypothetical protein EON57_01345 [Alphaproteobacteria bacterium]|nr:MAG: hypothetical protein EON57_01345 [Alphaproteobacteria bacterium]